MPVRLFLAVLWCLAVTACGALPKPFEPRTDEDRATLTVPAFRPEVQVEPVDGPPGPMARLLARAVADELNRRGIAAAANPREPGRFRLHGQAVANLDDPALRFIYLIHWHLVDDSGDVVALHTQGVEGTRWRWDMGDPRIIRAVGKDAARRIAGLLRVGGPTVETPEAAPAADGEALAVNPVTGAPGDGNRALLRAMMAALRAAGAPVTEDASAAQLALTGTVRVDPADGDRQRVRIVWTVATADGEELGTASQDSDVPAGSLDGPWGAVADDVAAAAVPGIAQIVAGADGPAGAVPPPAPSR